MSEFQIVKFRAVDRPLTDKQMQFMDRQSSRAEFTKWKFEVEYHYSSFRGDVDGMLRNGYDVYFTYSSYGCREIRMRLPNGMPFPKQVWSKYVGREGLKWTSDKNGKAGILSVSPYLEDENDPVLEFDDYLDATVQLREMLIAGDLRALYVLWLCCAMDSNEDMAELMEPPIPHGLAVFPSQAKELLPFFTVDPLLIDAAATGILAYQVQATQEDAVSSWLTSMPSSKQVEIIQRLLSQDPNELKAELLSEIRQSQQAVDWPVELPKRTISELMEICEGVRKKEDDRLERLALTKAKRQADKAEKIRQVRMAEMKSAPEEWLTKATKLVEERGTDNYREAASILADLSEAVGGEEGTKIARKHAAHLAKKNPNLKMLKSSLRKQQLLD
jgi:hypothetical protein